MDAETVERSLRCLLAGRDDGPLCAYLFGSVARGEPSARDVDVAVLYALRPPSTLESPCLALEGELERELRRPVQVIDLHRAPADLVHRVLRDGRILLDRDPSRRIAFEVRRRAEYFDLEPVRREYRRARGEGRRGR